MTFPVPSEHDEQSAFVSWFRYQYPKVRIVAIPNGAHLSGSPGQRAAQIARLKSEGLSPGVPDLQIPGWNLWIEMKRAKGGRISPEQQDWINYLDGIGQHVIVARGAEEAIEGVRAFLAAADRRRA